MKTVKFSSLIRQRIVLLNSNKNDLVIFYIIEIKIIELPFCLRLINMDET